MSIKCECGWDEKKEDYSCNLKGLDNHILFPPYCLLSNINDPSMIYYEFKGYSCTPKLNWCFLAEMEGPFHFSRPSSILKTRYGESTRVVFYHDNYEVPFTFSFNDLQKGYTIAILYGEWKTFMDMTDGIRQEDLDSVYVFKMSLKNLLKESKLHLKQCCFVCGETDKLSRCSKCQFAFYCGKDCQKSHWNTHKHVCRDMKVLKNLMESIQNPFNGFLSFKQLLYK